MGELNVINQEKNKLEKIFIESLEECRRDIYFRRYKDQNIK